MSIIYQAELTPGKREIIAGWLPEQPWRDGAGDVVLVGAYRFDDPAGEVGIEVHLVRSGSGPVQQVPLSYRGAAVPELRNVLVGTMEHSVLGTRYVYDATGDPVFIAELERVIRDADTQTPLMVIQDDGTEVERAAGVTVRGSGDAAPETGWAILRTPRPLTDSEHPSGLVGDIRTPLDGSAPGRYAFVAASAEA
ncbi:CG0192-related protein [Leucobacter sp. M11]|uniref:CG0192-related protein n=1 Tax=Leucobacter sp. M11 TaxID=2993565 RepID=UPI002D7EEDC1|nr:hypothetical protein [Leucobacter sp. M11]MEB4616301.1 hypothetical protein [Leucobacter sp. M11]